MEEILSGFGADEVAPAGEVENVLEGFENTSPTSRAPVAGRSLPAWLNGSLTLSAAWSFAHPAPPPGRPDYHGLSRLRGKLALELDHKFDNGWRVFSNAFGLYDSAYSIDGRDDYPEQVLDEYESELELGELYAQGRLSKKLDLKLGRQIIVWGKSDNLRVTDVLNPLDQREPGLVDIEDLRLPVTAAKLDYYRGAWNFSAIAIPEIRAPKPPPFGAEFYPFPTPQPVQETPSGTEFALAANGIFSAWDLSLYAARFYDDNPYLDSGANRPVLRRARLDMFGIALNLARGNFLYKAEAAHLRGLRYSASPTERQNRSDLFAGLEYAGFDNTTLSIELAVRRLHADLAGVERDDPQLALRYQSDLMHDRLHLTALATRAGTGLDGGFSRFSSAYDLVDALVLRGGVVLYHGGEAVPFDAIGDNDRVFVELEYSF